MACYSWLRIVCVSKRQIWHVKLSGVKLGFVSDKIRQICDVKSSNVSNAGFSWGMTRQLRLVASAELSLDPLRPGRCEVMSSVKICLDSTWQICAV